MVLEDKNGTRQELRQMAARLKKENEALLKLICELNSRQDIQDDKNANQKPNTIKP